MREVNIVKRSPPKSYFVMYPGRAMGFAHCLAGGKNLTHGTWYFKQKRPGECYADFIKRLTILTKDLPDPQIAMELMTIVTHGESNRVDAHQVMFSSGWPTHLQTICFTKGLREPEFLAIQSWRSKTHGKCRLPKGLNLDENNKSKWFKQQAKDYCIKNGWDFGTPDEAEALCMLDYLRQLHEPGYAFDRGHVFEGNQESLF